MNIMRDFRYSRLEMLEGIGESGVERIKNGKVLVIGCGALGSLCAMYLAASGVGTLGIADFDTIELSNLQRQLFFDEDQLGKSKAEILRQRINRFNSEIKVEVYIELITEKRAAELFLQYDFIIDGSDNPSTKNMTAKICEELALPYCIGGVREFSGQVMSWSPGHASYEDIFGDVPQCTGFTPCSLAGVLGPAAGVVASVQAAEAIKHIAGCGDMLYDKLWVFDLKKAETQIFSF